MIVEYKLGIKKPCGWRTEYVTANAERISEKRCKVTSIIDMTGSAAKRQAYDKSWWGNNEIGKIKIISRLTVIKDDLPLIEMMEN